MKWGQGALPTRALGTTGLSVTTIALGAAEIGDMSETFAYSVPEERGLATVRAALEGPFNFIDTAAAYGDGESERRIGQVLRERGGLPPGFVLSTKADRDLQTGDFSGEQIKRSIERSLRLLGLDRFQLVFLHLHRTTRSRRCLDGCVLGVVRWRCSKNSSVKALSRTSASPVDQST